MNFKTNEQLNNELEQRRKAHKLDESNDGFILFGEEEFIHKKIPYTIKALKYFTLTKGFIPMGRRNTDTHYVVEYPERISEFVKLFNSFYDNSEFLFYDTLHLWNDTQTQKQQLEECHKNAKEEIDDLPNRIKSIVERTKKMKQILKEIKKRK